MNELIIGFICAVLIVILWKAADVIKYYMQIKAKERSDKEYIERKEKERKTLEIYNSREARIKRQFSNKIECWFTFNGISYWVEQNAFTHGIAQNYDERHIRNKIIKNFNDDDKKSTDWFIAFYYKNNSNSLFWHYVSMEIKEEPIKEIKTTEVLANETINKIEELLKK